MEVKAHLQNENIIIFLPQIKSDKIQHLKERGKATIKTERKMVNILNGALAL